MKNREAPKVNRRLVLRGAGGLMLGLPLLEGFLPRRAAAQSSERSPFVLFVISVALAAAVFRWARGWVFYAGEEA